MAKHILLSYLTVAFIRSSTVRPESKTRYPLRVSRPVESIKLRPPGATLVTELQGQQKLSDLDQVVSPDGTLILSPSSMSSVLGATLHGVHEVDNTGSCGKRLASVAEKTSIDTYTLMSFPGEYCIECYHKVTIGRLWLTKQGVLFGPRPLIFLPWEKIASMSINRQGSQTSSFDLVLHSDDNDKTEFRMIEGVCFSISCSACSSFTNLSRILRRNIPMWLMTT